LTSRGGWPEFDFQLWLEDCGYNDDGNWWTRWKVIWFDENGNEIKKDENSDNR